MRTIAIGDIHGCSKALRTLIEAISPTSEDTLICLGDYVDRGPDSRGVVDLLMELDSRCKLILVRGNHELMFLGSALRGCDPVLWFQMGGQATLTSYGGNLQKISHNHLEFLDQKCVPFWETEEYLFVHANYLPDLPLARQPEFQLYWEHLTDRLPTPHISGKTVICGHTPQLGGYIADFGYLKCLDTYCFGGQYLTALDLQNDQIWQANKSGFQRHELEPWSVMQRRIGFLLKMFFGWGKGKRKTR
ncbi:MAG: serine/threonine protein phosphatase [Planctomycetes bacterium]|nr:serine/threonine protein phosphatase [Planctomycetota bacterium]